MFRRLLVQTSRPRSRSTSSGLIARYTRKTAGSKRLTAAAPRRAGRSSRRCRLPRPSGRRWSTASSPSAPRARKLWDIDGNEYIDILNGFGPTMLGHAPGFRERSGRRSSCKRLRNRAADAARRRSAELICELTGNERVTFCNTGSEAVMAAMRIARTVTGRNRIVFFAGDYHGQFDEVLVKRDSPERRAARVPGAPGIPARKSEQHHRARIRHARNRWNTFAQHASRARSGDGRTGAEPPSEPAADRIPAAKCAASPKHSGTAFIFDEVVTGFRVHPGGAQAVFGIRADMATYGKVVGGGMPIGMLAGTCRFMDALDGGTWQYRRRLRSRGRRDVLRRHLRAPSAGPGCNLRCSLADEGGRSGFAGAPQREPLRRWRSASTRSSRNGGMTAAWRTSAASSISISTTTLASRASSTSTCVRRASTSSKASRAISPRNIRKPTLTTSWRASIRASPKCLPMD